MAPYLKGGLYTKWVFLLWRKLIFLLLSALRPHWSGLVQSVCLLPQSLWLHTCISPAVFKKTLFLWCLLSLTLFPSFLPQGSLRGERRELMEASHLRMSLPRVLTLCTLSNCGSLYLFPCLAGRGFSDDGWTRHWSMHECSRMLSGVILLLCPFSRTIVFHFSSRSLAYLVSAFGSAEQCWGWVISHWVGSKSNHLIRYWLVSSTSFVP